jgi:hypothetical protein
MTYGAVPVRGIDAIAERAAKLNARLESSERRSC